MKIDLSKITDEQKVLIKKQISYDRQLEICGKEKADNVFYFAMIGFQSCQELNEKEISELKERIKTLDECWKNEISLRGKLLVESEPSKEAPKETICVVLGCLKKGGEKTKLCDKHFDEEMTRYFNNNCL